jgi:MFS superfamily sulfate permease-like transporter
MLGGNPGDGWQYPTPGAMLVAGSALLLVLRPLRGLPGPVVALGVATAVHHGLLASGVPVGPEVSKLLSPAALASEIGAGWSALALSPPPLSRILPGAATIALLATIEPLAAAAALRETSSRRTEYGRDLLGAGTGMLAGAGLGGVPASALTVPTMTAWLAGGRTRATQVAGATVPFALLLLGAPLLSELPLAGLAAVLAGAVLRLVELPLAPVVAGALPNRRWTDATISCAVVAAAVVFGLLAAVGIGALVSVVVFTSAMARTPIRRAYRNPTGRSQMRRPIELELRLRKEGDAIALLELEGPIFFGSADHALQRIEAEFAAGAVAVVLDMSRITHIDMSGGRRLLEACSLAPGRVLVAPLHRASRAAAEFEDLGLFDSLPPSAICFDLASAVERAESLVLRSGEGQAYDDRPDGAAAALQALGLSPDQAGEILAFAT